MKKTLLLCAMLLALAGKAAMADPVMQPALDTWSNGSRALIERPFESRLKKGVELPVLRGGIIVGIFTVNYLGTMNAWGGFQSHDPNIQMAPGDLVVLPTVDMARAPFAAAADIETTSVLWSSPGGYTLWCLINRGSVDGLRPLMRGFAFRGADNIGEFNVSFVGKHRSYGILTLAPNLAPALPKTSELLIRFLP